MALTFGSLFAGIGGIDLGLERAGMICKFQVEIDDYATRILAKHWPEVPRFRDVRSVGIHNLSRVDLIAGGFPCQDISNAGKRAGITGERSGLWTEFYRLVRELRPRYVLVENVAALLHRGIDRVLGDLAACGYDTEWQCIPASAVGAPHNRDRVFIVAYTNTINGKGHRVYDRPMHQTPAAQSARWVPDGYRKWVADRQGNRRIRCIPNSDICRVADGVPDRMDRLSGLGNAVVPQVAEYVGRLIVAHATQ